jgi:hypothetical protein
MRLVESMTVFGEDGGALRHDMSFQISLSRAKPVWPSAAWASQKTE